MKREELQAARVALGLAAHLLYDEPTDEDVEAYLKPGLFSAAPFGMEDAAVSGGLAAMDAWCGDAAAAVQAGAATVHDLGRDLRSDWLNLLTGAGEPKAPSWAGYYLNPSSTILGESALAVRRLYRQHGFQVERMNQEPDDHLGLMLSFIGVLIQLELEADGADASCENIEVSPDTAAAQCQAQLLQSYVLPWLPLWRWSVERFARTEFYRGVGELVFGLVRAYGTRFGFRYVDDADNPRFVAAS